MGELAKSSYTAGVYKMQQQSGHGNTPETLKRKTKGTSGVVGVTQVASSPNKTTQRYAAGCREFHPGNGGAHKSGYATFVYKMHR